MAGGALRRASGLLLGRLRSGGATTTAGQQARATHDLAAHHNKHVESWLSRREDIEAEFVWNSKTVLHVVMGVLVVPGLIYNGIVWCAHDDDDYAGRPRRCGCGVCVGVAPGLLGGCGRVLGVRMPAATGKRSAARPRRRRLRLVRQLLPVRLRSQRTHRCCTVCCCMQELPVGAR
jgi:hypothetical protein